MYVSAIFLILFRKYLAIGRALAAWLRRPIRVSSSSFDAFLFSRIFFKSVCQELNLSEVSDSSSVLVLIFHPKMVADSASVPSSASFDSDRQSSLCTGSFSEIGLQNVWMARAMAFVPRCLLLSRSGMAVIPSSMYISTLPLGSNGIQTSNSLPCEKGDVSTGSESNGSDMVCGE